MRVKKREISEKCMSCTVEPYISEACMVTCIHVHVTCTCMYVVVCVRPVARAGSRGHGSDEPPL